MRPNLIAKIMLSAPFRYAKPGGAFIIKERSGMHLLVFKYFVKGNSEIFFLRF